MPFIQMSLTGSIWWPFFYLLSLFSFVWFWCSLWPFLTIAFVPKKLNRSEIGISISDCCRQTIILVCETIVFQKYAKCIYDVYHYMIYISFVKKNTELIRYTSIQYQISKLWEFISGSAYWTSWNETIGSRSFGVKPPCQDLIEYPAQQVLFDWPPYPESFQVNPIRTGLFERI